MFEGCRPASPPSRRAQRGFGPIRRTPVRLGVVVHLPRSRRRASAMSSVGEEVGRARAGRASTASSQSSVSARDRASAGERRGGGRAPPRRPRAPSAGRRPARSARPPWPPNSPSVNVARLPRSRDVEAAAHGEVGAAARARARRPGAARRPAGTVDRACTAATRRAVEGRAHVGAGQRHDARRRGSAASVRPACTRARRRRRALPTSRFASRNDSASIGPDGGTPTSQ